MQHPHPEAVLQEPAIPPPPGPVLGQVPAQAGNVVAATAPAGVSPTGYGSTVLAGTFKEAITGLRKNGAPDAAQSTHNVEGTFLLRRVSDTATYSIP